MEKDIRITDKFIIIPSGSTEEERDNTILKRYGDKVIKTNMDKWFSSL